MHSNFLRNNQWFLQDKIPEGNLSNLELGEDNELYFWL
jgi:hypothetical protein